MATPNRALVLAGKTLAYLATATVTSVVAVGAGLATAAVTLTIGNATPIEDVNAWPVAGAALYLVLIGFLGLALAGLLRSLIPPLVAMLTLVLIVSPLLAASTEHARWLPDKAGSLLYLPDADPVLTAGTGALVLLAWITLTVIAAATAFVNRDA